MRAADAVPAGGALIVEAPFDPRPLRQVLAAKGFSSYGRRLEPGHWRIVCRRGPASDASPPELRSPTPPPAPRGAGPAAAASMNVGSAHQRLLPEAIPLRFFGTAVAAHALAWIALLATAGAAPWYQGGPGPVPAAFHVLTVGVLLATAVGASLQMLPVALGRPAPPARRCHAVYLLLIAGGIALITGFATDRLELIEIGAGALAAAISLYVATVIGILRGASSLAMVRAHVGAALACLGLGALLLALDYRLAILLDHRAAAAIHALLVAFGFLGLLALGLSQILIPMFVIAEPSASNLPWLGLALALAGLVAAAAGLAAAWWPAVAAGAGLGLAAVACHVVDTEAMLAKRMRKRLGNETLLVRLAWAMAALGLAPGGAMALDLAPETAPALFGFVVLYGWLLSLVLGVQQRILPFLGSMHVLRARSRPLTPTKLVDERGLRIRRWCHCTAIAVAGLLVAAPVAIRVGAAVGIVGAVAYATFAITVFRRARPHLGAATDPRGGEPGR